MDQYRRSFVHHAIDGMLLGQLTPEQLRVWCLAALPSYCRMQKACTVLVLTV